MEQNGKQTLVQEPLTKQETDHKPGSMIHDGRATTVSHDRSEPVRLSRLAGLSEELRHSETWRGAGAELIATLLFVFLGAGSVVVTEQLTGGELDAARLVTIALAHGVAIMLLVAATSPISGGHINPAVTFVAMVTRRISIAKGSIYIAAQITGAIMGALLIAAVVPEATAGNLGSHGLGNGVTAGAGLVVEIILTFVLVFVVLTTAMNPKGLVHLAPVAIGLAVLVDHIVGIQLTGASMNPARSFGPALVAGQWTDHWIYWLGPIVGGLLAAVVYRWLHVPDPKTT